MLAPRLLEGFRVLVVEDNLLLAEVTRLLLEDSGCAVVGPAGRLQRGLKLAQDGPIDGAILDINLHGEMSFPIAEVLSARSVPFIFVTGYEDRSIVPLAFRSAPRLDKPVTDEQLLDVMIETFIGKRAENDPQGGRDIVGGECRWRAISTRR
jgi:CheY-like chemotaxis protein